MEDSLRTDVVKFSEAIITQDLAAEDALRRQLDIFKCKGLLVKALPLDTSSNVSPTMISQLIATVGNDAADFIKSVTTVTSAADVQGHKILTATAASGVGKTHLAYAVGGKYMYSVLIRVAKQYDLAGKPRITLPWNSLMKLLNVYEDAAAALSDFEDAFSLAKNAFKLLELLILSYLDVSTAAIAVARTKDPQVPAHTIQQLLLRFHRNEKAEEFVQKHFEHLMTTMQVDTQLYRFKDGSSKTLRTVSDDALVTLRHQLATSFSELPAPSPDETLPKLLICVDEASALIPYYPQLFGRQKHYVRHKYTSSDADAAELPVAKVECEGLFYAVACLMCELSAKHKWVPFVTSAASEIDTFKSTGKDFSTVRGSTYRISPTVQFDLETMKSILKEYFDMPDEVLNDYAVNKRLAKCIGRPLLFVDTVFSQVVAKIMAAAVTGEHLKSWSAPLLALAFKTGYKQKRDTFSTRMSHLLAGSLLLPTRTDETSRALVPCLIDALYNQNGEFTVTNKDLLAKCVSTGLLPCSTSMRVGAKINIRDEPLVAAALENSLNDELRKINGVNALLKLRIMPTYPAVDSGHKGPIAEEALAYDFALRTRLKKLQGNRMMLTDLLAPMYLGDRVALAAIGDFECQAVRIVVCTTADLSTCVFRKFVKEDGTLDDTIILCNIPKRMGVDVAFLVRGLASAAGAGDAAPYRMVVAQLKNTDENAFQDIMKSLSPGLQYLTTAQRLDLVAGKSIKLVKPLNCGAGYNDWMDYMAFAASYPSLVENWIRLPVVARPVHPKLYAYAEALPWLQPSWLQAKLEGWTAEKLQAAMASPVFMLRLDAPTWLTEELRNSFVTPSSSTLSLSSKPVDWTPISVQQAAIAARRAGVAVIVPPPAL